MSVPHIDLHQVNVLANHRRRNRGNGQVRAFLLSARLDGASAKVACAMTVIQFCKELYDARPVFRDMYNKWSRICSDNLDNRTPVQ